LWHIKVVEYRFYLAILYSDENGIKISKKFSHRLVPSAGSGQALSKVEGEHRALRASILFFYLCELCVLCGGMRMWKKKNMDSCFRRNDIKKLEKQLQNQRLGYSVSRRLSNPP